MSIVIENINDKTFIVQVPSYDVLRRILRYVDDTCNQPYKYYRKLNYLPTQMDT